MNTIILIKRKPFKIITLVLIFSLVFLVFNYIRINNSFDNIRFGLLGKTSAEAFLYSDKDNTANRQIEIFSINKESVVKKAPLSPVIKNEAVKYLNSITGLYVKVKALPDKGYIIKIPLEPPVKIQTEWLDDLVHEIFVIFPEDKTPPYLLILDDNNRPYFYTFDESTEILLKELKFTDILPLASDS